MRIKGPLFSVEARGTIAGALEFSKRKGKNFLRFHQQPTGIKSTAQKSQISRYREACTKWATLSPAEKKQWNDFNAG